MRTTKPRFPEECSLLHNNESICFFIPFKSSLFILAIMDPLLFQSKAPTGCFSNAISWIFTMVGIGYFLVASLYLKDYSPKPALACLGWGGAYIASAWLW